MTDYTPTTEEVRRGKRTVKDGKFYYTERYVTDIEFDRWLAEVKANARKAEREYLIQYLQSEIKSANEWCEENKDYCTSEDDIKNSMVIAAYENLAETLIANPYRQAEDA